ncbi:hypothetical protein HN018_18835 [Lichenicola cladoniae]|uniref:Uncharacterized protein n=1 Tax=Lichenicola cladoniae TaxID=1484109 RepID=A0A6M8HTF7_9PROT|nr:hypothetical protein [Lichenicola cladoniae]NPD67532.1 hypothetical protein [Acetobacteraceae bacterium]QKE91814.1 hypothetical protein HN018_18835 [Lichenicola cladoniae]
MPFDGINTQPERRQPRGAGEPERPLSVRDRIVAAAIAAVLLVITLANCKLLLGYWHG